MTPESAVNSFIIFNSVNRFLDTFVNVDFYV